ncbi:MAG: enoyl-CoA hydratase/isomerase family protein [Haloglomus sp.]
MIRYDLRDGVAHVTLDRPEKKNALTMAGLADLHEAFTRAEADEAARVVVLGGAGDAFCAGDDIASLATLGEETDPEELATRLYDALFAPERLSVPVVAAVDGLAYGGGFELAAAADLAVATDDATFALPETHIGAYPPYAVARIGAICGKKRLLDLVLTGDPVDADTARDWGLVNRVVPPAELDEAVADYVDAVDDAPAEALGLAKRYVHAAMAADDERERIVEGFDSVADEPACLEAARAFLER